MTKYAPKCDCWKKSSSKQSLTMTAAKVLVTDAWALSEGLGLCPEGQRFLFLLVCAGLIGRLHPVPAVGKLRHGLPVEKEDRQRQVYATIAELDDFLADLKGIMEESAETFIKGEPT